MSIRLRYKVWLENETGKPIIGEGRLQILRAIRQTGSILKAAQMLGLSYRNVWAKIKDAENHCGFKLVATCRQGSTLTSEGKQLLRKYEELQRTCRRSAQNKFGKLFSKTLPTAMELDSSTGRGNGDNGEHDYS